MNVFYVCIIDGDTAAFFRTDFLDQRTLLLLIRRYRFFKVTVDQSFVRNIIFLLFCIYHGTKIDELNILLF